MKKSKDDLKFEIDQLRKDKMIYALESLSTSIISLFVLFVSGMLFPTMDPVWLFFVTTSIALGYWIYTVVGNTARLRKIKILEEELERTK